MSDCGCGKIKMENYSTGYQKKQVKNKSVTSNTKPIIK